MDMMRRRAMMVAEEGEPAPLSSLYQCDVYAVSSSIWYGGDGNHFYFKTTANSRGPHVNKTKAQASHITSGTVVTVHSGDEVELIVKNIVYAIGSADTTMNVAFKKNDSAGTTIFALGDKNYSKNTSGTHPGYTATTTVSQDAAITDVYFYLYRAATFEFDLELYVNGVRYL